MEENTKLPSEIMAKPAISFEEFFDSILGLPASTAELICRQEPRPAFFLIGRRRYILTTDAVSWLNEKAKTTAYTPRRNANGHNDLAKPPGAALCDRSA